MVPPENPSPQKEKPATDYESEYEAWKVRARERVALGERVRENGRELYRDESGLTLKESIAAFVDELGFAERVKNLTPSELREDILIYDDARLRLSNPSKYSDEELRVVFFSDNIGLGKPLRMPYESHDLAAVLVLLADYQLNMALKGRFVRGGITRGPLYADHSRITGDALVRAVEMEKELAVVPRILVDAKCRELAKENVSGDPTFGISEFSVLLLRDSEHVFLNYLGFLLLEGDDFELPTDVALQRHRDMIKVNLYNDRGAKINYKYKWAADYHDFFVTQVIWRPEYMVGSEQTHHFASFDLSWMTEILGPSPAARILTDNFEHVCAQLDTTPTGEHISSAVQNTGNEDRDPFPSIDHNCSALLAGLSTGDAAIDTEIAEMVEHSRQMVAAISTNPKLSLEASWELNDALAILDKGLQLLRVDPRAGLVALRGLEKARHSLGLDP